MGCSSTDDLGVYSTRDSLAVICECRAALSSLPRKHVRANVNQMLRGVIFDMDGVIIDSHPAHRMAWKSFLVTLGKSVSDTELDFVLDGRKRTEILRHFLGDLSEDQLRRYGDCKDHFFQKASLELKLIPGAIDLLTRLRDAGIATALATSASESRTANTLGKLRLRDNFVAIVTGDDVAVGKPDPSVYQLAYQRLNIPPHSVVAMEDAVSGIHAARGAGLACVGVASNGRREALRAAGASLVLENLVGLSVARLEGLLSPQATPE
jgi:beta-phosphoglucomutase